jgi:hypothetical protein
MDAYLFVDETIKIAWQGNDIGETVQKWMRDGDVRQHYSADGETTLIIHWGNVRSVRLGKYDNVLRG